MKIETWNTGRRYTNAGQRIAATRIGETIYFVDLDRNLDGMFAGSIGTFTARPKGWTLEQTVMDAYDNAPFNKAKGCVEPIYTGIGYEDPERAIKSALLAAAALDGVTP